MLCKIGVISGDGIGPEIVREARKVLDAVAARYGHEFDYTDLLLGGASIDVHGVPLTEETIRSRIVQRTENGISGTEAVTASTVFTARMITAQPI